MAGGRGAVDNPAVEIHLWTFCVQRSGTLLRYEAVIFSVQPAVNALFVVELTGFRMTAIKLIMAIITIERTDKWYPHTHIHTRARTHTHTHTHAHAQASV